ncbi:MAG TPA: SelB C-terminal domain-containing protein [Solirubrobacteraceae bacterium]
MSDQPLTLGTAGHIDHGKTTLIKALTGVDTDRLPEERSRGISIELGYAQLALPSGRALSVIDVPGHERLVRTMVAGATGIDLYLMTVAADDGVMPQTREHAAVLHSLGVAAGVVAVTKADLADPELAMAEAAELLPGAELVAVSATTGAGLDQLKARLDLVAAQLRSRASAAGGAGTVAGAGAVGGAGGRATPEARLHIDRVFTIRGAGTVVTGTLWAGQIARGDELQLLPSGQKARVRGVQVHDEARDSAAAGQRVAVNLTGVAVADVARGDVLASADADLRPTYVLDAQLDLAGEPEHGTRVQVHHGTRESPARLAWLGGDFWQIRAERPLIALRGDRVVVRQIAPPDTLGGGTVLDAHPRKHGPGRDVLVRLRQLARGEDPDQSATLPPRAASPEPPSLPPTQPPTQPLSASALALEARLEQAGLGPPPDSELDASDLGALREAGRAVRVGRALHYHPDALAEAQSRIVEAARRHGGTITLAQVRDELKTSRKYAQALLEHLDSERVTIRRGDAHALRRARSGP